MSNEIANVIQAGLTVTHWTTSGKKPVIVSAWQDNNLISEIECSSQKQAYFIMCNEYPEALTPRQQDMQFDAMYNSAEGRAWRRKNQGLR